MTTAPAAVLSPVLSAASGPGGVSGVVIGVAIPQLIGWALTVGWGMVVAVAVLTVGSTIHGGATGPARSLIAARRRRPRAGTRPEGTRTVASGSPLPRWGALLTVPGGPGAGVLVGAAAGLAGVLALVSPLAAPLGLTLLAWPALARHQRRATHRARLTDALPETIDLLSLAVGAGLTVNLAVRAAAQRGRGPVAEGLALAVTRTAEGRLLADTLEGLPGEVGEPVRPLTAALVASARHGAPLAAGLDRLATTARLQRRQAAEARAKRVPVLSLFPLTMCILPAFALLAVVPLVAVSLQDIGL